VAPAPVQASVEQKKRKFVSIASGSAGGAGGAGRMPIPRGLEGEAGPAADPNSAFMLALFQLFQSCEVLVSLSPNNDKLLCVQGEHQIGLWIDPTGNKFFHLKMEAIFRPWLEAVYVPLELSVGERIVFGNGFTHRFRPQNAQSVVETGGEMMWILALMARK